MEVIEIISNFISTIGFPIFACVMMFIQNNKMQETLTRNTDMLNDIKTLIQELHHANN